MAEWQTRQLQVLVSERAWGFKSPLAHDEIGWNPLHCEGSLAVRKPAITAWTAGESAMLRRCNTVMRRDGTGSRVTLATTPVRQRTATEPGNEGDAQPGVDQGDVRFELHRLMSDARHAPVPWYIRCSH